MLDYNALRDTPKPAEIGLEDTERNQHLLQALLTSLSGYAYGDDGYIRQTLDAMHAHGFGEHVTLLDLSQEMTSEEVAGALGIENNAGVLNTSEWAQRHTKLVVLGLDVHLQRHSGGQFDDLVMWVIRNAEKASAGTVIGFRSEQQTAWQILHATLPNNYWAAEMISDFWGTISIA